MHHIIGDLCPRSCGIERILYYDWNILVKHRIDCRRIHDLCTKVAQLHRFNKRQLVDNVGIAYHSRISRHKPINIRPNFQQRGIQRRCDNRRCIIATSSAKICYIAIFFIRRYKARHNCHFSRKTVKHTANKTLRSRKIHHMLIELPYCLYEIPRIKILCRINNSAYNRRRESLAITDNYIQ